jgi:alpha-beta hydrolase superfamily lysophospholipase
MAEKTGLPTGDARPAQGPGPSRSVDEIARDIKSERAALENAFADLQRDVEQAVEQVKRQATGAARTALVIGPVVGVAAGGLVAAVALLGRRRRGEDD